MVLDHVAQGARIVVVRGARAHPLGLGHGYLDVVDVMAVPDLLENTVAKAQDHEVADRFLAQIMVDAEDLAFVQILVQAVVDCPRALQIHTDRLLHHDPAEAAPMRRRDQAGFMQALDPVQNRAGRNREIENPVGRQASGGLDLLQPRLEPAEAVQILDSRQVIQPRRKAVPTGVLHLGVGIAPDSVAGVLAKLIDRHRAAGASQDHGFVGQHVLAARIKAVERRNQLAHRKVPGRPEDYHRAGRNLLGTGKSYDLVHGGVPLRLRLAFGTIVRTPQNGTEAI